MLDKLEPPKMWVIVIWEKFILSAKWMSRRLRKMWIEFIECWLLLHMHNKKDSIVFCVRKRLFCWDLHNDKWMHCGNYHFNWWNWWNESVLGMFQLVLGLFQGCFKTVSGPQQPNPLVAESSVLWFHPSAVGGTVEITSDAENSNEHHPPHPHPNKL